MSDVSLPPDEPERPKKPYKVGYKNPPIEHQFQKDVSGNPNGRRAGSRNFRTELNEELNQTVPIKENGKKRRTQKGRAIIKAMVAKAMNGDVRAATTVLRWWLERDDVADGNAAMPEHLSDEDREILKDLARRLGFDPDDDPGR